MMISLIHFTIKLHTSDFFKLIKIFKLGGHKLHVHAHLPACELMLLLISFCLFLGTDISSSDEDHESCQFLALMPACMHAYNVTVID